jgi:hypothetical protein
MIDIYIARPRDPDANKRKPGERTLESYRADGPWVVDCFDAHLAWKYTFYGMRSMSRKQAEAKERLCQRIENDLKAKRHSKKRTRQFLGDRSGPPGPSTCPDKP